MENYTDQDLNWVSITDPDSRARYDPGVIKVEVCTGNSVIAKISWLVMSKSYYNPYNFIKNLKKK